MKAISAALISCALGCALYGKPTEASTEKVLYAFCSQQNCADGQYPSASVIDIKGTLYGTTLYGGTGSCYPNTGCGTVYSLNLRTGIETVLHSFQNNGVDAVYSQVGLVDVSGRLYGTSEFGGTGNCDGTGCGTVFAVNAKTGAEAIIHSFQNNGTDGQEPGASLMNVNGTLNGTTLWGGRAGLGTIFSVNPKTGVEKVMYSFGVGLDGHAPEATLIHFNGTFYGTTTGGGTGINCACGTIFSFNPNTGAERILYSFCSQENCADGEEPLGSLIIIGQSFYGTTLAGGTGSCEMFPSGCGTVFTLDRKSGKQRVLHSFQNNSTDGGYLYGGVIDLGDKLYGTNYEGGYYGYGTVFSLDRKTGAEAVLHSFGNGRDGFNPDAALINVGGTLYGTTYFDGTNSGGTVFSVAP